MIRDHDYKPAPRFQKLPAEKPKLFFGCELEVEVPSREDDDALSDQVMRKAPFVYCKYDGSLNYGFEIVSHPMSWRWLKDNKNKETISGLLAWLDKKGVKSYNTRSCGLHVHVSKAGLGRGVLERMLRFVFNPEHASFVRKISRRSKSNLEHWARISLDRYDRDEALNPRSRDKDRMLGLNTLPQNTAEFRLFRGTLSYDGFMRAMEFCHSIIHAIKSKKDDITADDLSAYVEAKADEYPNLWAFMKKHGLGAAGAAAKAAEAGQLEGASEAPAAVAPAALTASHLSLETLEAVYKARRSGQTWGAIEDRLGLRRANGMTAFHAYEKFARLNGGRVMVGAAS